MEYLRPATMTDAIYLFENMRQDDWDECVAMGHHPMVALMKGLRNSKPCVSLISPDNEVVGIAGVNGAGMIWMLGTDKISDYPMTFVRQSKIMISMFYEESRI